MGVDTEINAKPAQAEIKVELSLAKNMGLKHWILSNNHFKTQLLFSKIWVWEPFSAWILVRVVAQT